MSIVASAATLEFANEFIHRPPHAILLTGSRGVGLKTLAMYLANEAGRLHRLVEPVAKTPKGQAIIDVERVRALYDDTRTNLSGAHFIIIDDADRMNHAAQNALLKLLEEPNPTIHFIMTSHAPDLLLPTIRSRVWQFVVPPVDELASRRLLKSKGVNDQTKLAQLLYVASGLPAQLSRLSTEGPEFERLVSDVKQARAFIEGTAYDKLIIVNGLKDDREGALRFIDMVVTLLRKTLITSVDPKVTLAMIDRLLAAHEAVRANGNVRLQLAAAVV